MTGDRLIRGTLWATALFNIGGCVVFAFPDSVLGRLNGFPAEVPPLYRFLAAMFIFLYGCAYAWLARQPVPSRAFIAFAALNKFCVFAIVVTLWLREEASLRNVVALSPDFWFAAAFVYWLLRFPPWEAP
jgi:hypothetical protein